MMYTTDIDFRIFYESKQFSLLIILIPANYFDPLLFCELFMHLNACSEPFSSSQHKNIRHLS